jgi:putative ABC transport system permease protein
MFVSYLKVAIRSIMKSKGYSFINVAGLAIGMACCLLIMLWVQDELSYDSFHENADQICRVLTVGGTVTPSPLAETLKDEYPEVVDAARHVSRKWKLSYEDRSFVEQGALVDPSFLEIFTFRTVSGDLSAAFADPYSIVITKSVADKLFGEADPIGMPISARSQFELTVAAVIEDVPRNSHFNFDWLASEHLMHFLWGSSDFRWESNNFITYVMLQRGVSHQSVSEEIAGVVASHDPGNSSILRLQPLRDIHLHGSNGGGTITYVYVFSVMAVFLLLIACVNFMNLATARSVGRAKEVGMRKVTGACRIDLVGQFMGESLLHSFVAMLFAVILVELMLPGFNNLSGKQLSLNYVGNWELPLGLVCIALFTGLVAGSYPALFLSSYAPMGILRRSAGARGRSVLFRRILVIGQFMVSVALIIGTTVVHSQLQHIRNMDLGYDEEHILCMTLRRDLAMNLQTVSEKLSQHSSIRGIVLTSSLLDESETSTDEWDWEGKATDQKLNMKVLSVTYDFPEVFGTEMVEGRFFSREYSTDVVEAIIVNEAAVRAMQMESPVGRQLSCGNISHIKGEIIGVVKDFHFRPVHFEIQPLLIRIIPSWLDNVCMKIASENVPGTIDHIRSTLKELAPGYPFEYRFLDDRIDGRYRAEQRMGSILLYASLIAVFVSCLGLLGLISFSAEQRTKEIGIRKVLGASELGMVTLLSKEFLTLVLIANVISVPIAYFAMNSWLQRFAYRTALSWHIFALSAMAALLIALLTVSFRAIKAARANPVDAIRCE